jgi:hypothetical protein
MAEHMVLTLLARNLTEPPEGHVDDIVRGSMAYSPPLNEKAMGARSSTLSTTITHYFFDVISLELITRPKQCPSRF